MCNRGEGHSHSSVQASHCRVDEAPDDGVQDEGQNLRRRRQVKETMFISMKERHNLGYSYSLYIYLYISIYIYITRNASVVQQVPLKH